MIDGRLTSFELFAGAGGLVLGAELAGFQSLRDRRMGQMGLRDCSR